MLSLARRMRNRFHRSALVSAAFATGLVMACASPTAEEGPGVAIRIANESGVHFDRVDVHFPGVTVEYGGIPAGVTTDYRTVDVAYRFATTEVEVNGHVYRIQVIDYVGETPLRDGRYTYALRLQPPASLDLRFRADD